MELKEYILIFKRYLNLFLAVVVITVLTGILIDLSISKGYESSLTMNITRMGKQKTEDYKYDDFYRLQADEKFADTVVRWLESPRVLVDIHSDAKTDSIKKLKAQRLTSQMIQISYQTEVIEPAKKISKSIIKIVDRETEGLNKFQNEEYWFKIMGSSPVIRKNNPDLVRTFLVSLVLGIFFGFWIVLIKHYLKD